MTKTILLCMSNTGGGHRSAAKAVSDAIQEIAKQRRIEVNVVIVDVVERSNPLHHLYVSLYNFILRRQQSWMNAYYALIEHLRPNNSEVGYLLTCGYAKKLFKSVKPSVVVSLHPMTNHYLARAMEELYPSHKPPLIVVMTDPNGDFWTGWACKDAELTIAPNEFVRQRLLMLGLRPDRVRVLGMPVNPEFLRKPKADRRQVLTRLGLSADRFTICLTGGWVGGGHLREIYRQLSAVEKQCQVLVVCGHNERLRVEIERLSNAFPQPTVVVSSVQSMSDLMGAADLLITKAGGLTTFEAVARRLPMAIDVMDVMPQEAATAKMLADAGLARLVTKPSDIVEIVERGSIRSSNSKLPLPTVYDLDLTDKSVYEIAKVILSSCEESAEEDGQSAPNQEQLSA